MKIHNEARSFYLRCVAFATISFLSLGMLGCNSSGSTPTGAATPPLLSVNVIETKQYDNVYSQKLLFGTLKPRRSSHMGFARGGRVETVLVGVGDIVSEGAEIALLGQTQLDNELTSITEEIDRIQQELISLQGNPNTLRQQSIDDLEQKLADLQRQGRELLSTIADGKIVAPYDCVIVERNINEGDTVSIGRPVLKVNENAPPIIEANVAATIADQFQNGQSAWVYKGDSPIEAIVESKSPEITAASRTQTIVLTFEPPDDTSWKFGEVVEIRSWTQTDQSGFWLPYSALQREAGGLWSAYVAEEEGRYQVVARRTLELLQISGETVFVSGSLNEGDRLIVDGSNRVVPGQRVTSNFVALDIRVPSPPGPAE